MNAVKPSKLPRWLLFLIWLACIVMVLPFKLAEWIDRKRASDDEKNTPSRVVDEESPSAERPVLDSRATEWFVDKIKHQPAFLTVIVACYLFIFYTFLVFPPLSLLLMLVFVLVIQREYNEWRRKEVKK